MIKNNYVEDDHHTDRQNLKKKIQFLESCLLFSFFSIGGILLISISNTIKASSFSASLQDMDDNVFTSLQKINDRITLLSEEDKSFLMQLEELQNNIEERIKMFEKRNKIPNKYSKHYKKYKHHSTIVNKFVGKQRDSKLIEEKIQENKDNHDEVFIGEAISQERTLQLSKNSSFCDANLFQLNLRLDKYPQDISWQLIDSVNGILVINKSYERAELYSIQNSIICIADGSYVFTIFDSHGDGMCVGVDECSPYNITINDELIIEGNGLVTKQSYNFQIHNNRVCEGFKNNLIELHIQMKQNVFSERSWELIDLKSNKVLANQTHSTNFLCVDDGIYLFSYLNLESENILNNEYLKITVNGDVLIFGPISMRYRFRIIDGLAENYYYCTSKPNLNPMNGINGNVYDERISKSLELFESLSSHNTIHNDKTPQYKAACSILYDDVNDMNVEDELILERYILYLFLISTEILKWKETLPLNFCDAVGVNCEDGYIVELLFRRQNLVGTIPTEIGYLQYLRYIDFGQNNLVGTIPTQLGRLIHLEDLYLDENKLSGRIPSNIGKMKKLNHLWLYGNNLKGSIPSQLFNATELIVLDLGDNRLTGSISTSIGQLDKLVDLLLMNNQLTGSIPTHIGLMSSLIDVWLRNNKLAGQVPTEISNWKDVRFLYIDSNKLTGTLPDVFDNFSQMQSLYAYDNSFTGEIPSSIWRVDSLIVLDLLNNDLHGSVPDDFCHKTYVLQLEDSSWFSDLPKVNCSCCEKSCQFWDAVLNPTGTNTNCPFDNILVLFDPFDINHSIYPTYIKDVHTSDTLDTPYEGICSSPTGCYEVRGQDWNDGKKEKEWFFGYSGRSRSIVSSDPKNPICDAVEICGQSIDSNHPRRKIVNYFMKNLISNSSILYDSASYEYKALCWIIEQQNVNDLNECDGTLFQFCVMGLFFSSTNYLDSLDYFNSLCDISGIECDASNKFVKDLNFRDKNLTGFLNTEIGLLESLKKFDVSNNKLKGTINGDTFHEKLPKLEIFDINNNSFEGEIPKTLLSHPSLKAMNLSTNLFVGTLPSSFDKSTTLESFEIADNLLQGGIPDELFDCLQLRTIDISQNKFNGTVPILLGQLSEIRNIRFYENEIKGSLPSQVFSLKQIRVLMMQSNKLTGSIPTSVGNLKNLNQLILNHNSLKGNIPSELHNLKQLQTLHLHHNKLTGTSPNITVTDMTSYITDCGFPNYALPNPLKCDSCTMCCNSEGTCQEIKLKNNIWKTSMQILGFIMLGFILLLSLRSIFTTAFFNGHINLKDIYNDTSVHSFIFANGIAPKTIYCLSMSLQVALFVVYMLASDINKEATDWKFTYQCPDNRIDCIDLKKTNSIGWFLFTIVILCFMGSDIVMSMKQVDQGLIRKDVTLVVSGLMLLFLTIFAIYSSFVYNRALAEKNTDLILNAVVLIFVMELDDKIFIIFKKFFPRWTENVKQDIKLKMN